VSSAGRTPCAPALRAAPTTDRRWKNKKMLFQHFKNVEKIVIETNILNNVGTFLENVGRSLQKMLIKMLV
jgi:hypothetical protein